MRYDIISLKKHFKYKIHQRIEFILNYILKIIVCFKYMNYFLNNKYK
jgi:hypothetical protein